MTKIQLTMKNFSFAGQLKAIFEGYSNDYEYTSDGIFRKIKPPLCADCGTPMSHNGFNNHTKKQLGDVKIGKYQCPNCSKNIEEEHGFWENATSAFFGLFGGLCQLLRVNHVSLDVIEKVSNYIYPRSKDSICTMITSATDNMEVPKIEDVQFVHYDEQHPKAGRSQKYRLTLLDYRTKQVIADELFDSKDGATIEDFLRRNLDTHKPIFIVTDLYRGYDEIFKKIFGNRVAHQFCLFHQSKLIVNDFPKKTTIEEELLKYRMLNIFYDRTSEIQWLSCLIEEEQEMKKRGEKTYREWLEEAQKWFKKFVHGLEKERRRNHRNMATRNLYDAKKNLDELMNKIDAFKIIIQKRLKQIEKDWQHLMIFQLFDGAPATNNPIENYYSCSLKTHRKQQLDVPGIEEQMKLSRLKRWGMFGIPQKTLIEAFFVFIPFMDWK
jgi:hypothetical protein